MCVGLVKREHVQFSPTEKAAASSSVSVFSRLDGKGDTPPSSTKHYSPHTLTPPSSSTSTSTSGRAPNLKRTIVTATSPSPKKLNLRVMATDGRKVNASAIGSGGGSRSAATGKSGTKIELSGGLVSSSSSFTSKEPVKSRLGARGTDHRVTSRGDGGGSRVTSWPETVSSSIVATSTSGRVSTRLGGGGVHRTSTAATRKPQPTMMADSASNPQPKAISRLGSMRKTAKSTTAVSSATSSRPRGQRSKPASMVADEYELKRQLDIRSRLNEKEKEVRDRRSGLLHGRLGQHRVFQRLT